MLRIANLGYRIEGRPLFEGASVTVPAGHKTGVVGRNGTGKTTLFRLILGELSPDEGEITLPRGARIGAVRQEVEASRTSLIDTVLAADDERAALMAEAETATDPARIAEIQTRLADIEAHSAEARAASVLSGLGFPPADQAKPCAEFSGGWRMRVALAGVLFARPDYLLLDEPTNYLDLEGTIWLESYIARYPHTALIISHDRGLLNRAVRSILHLSGRRLTLYGGNYDVFARERQARLEQDRALARKQEAQRAHIQSFVDRFRYKASKARQAQSRLKMLERLQPIAGVSEAAIAGFHFPRPKPAAPPLLSLDGVAVGYDGCRVLSHLSLRIDQDDRIALLGANGQGKSTLAKLIAGRLAPMAGQATRARGLKVGYFAQHQLEELRAGESPLQHLTVRRPEAPPARLRATLAAGGIGAEIADNPVARLSGGQKARLALLLATLEAPHILVLDEPTNHLDIESREALVHALAEYEGAIVLISHDPWLVEAVADRLWLVRDGRVRPFDGDVEDYRAMLLAERGEARPAAPRAERARRPPRPTDLSRLRSEVRSCEARIARIEEMRDRIDGILADPALYAQQPPEKIAELNRKRQEILAGLERAETLWLEAEERLSAASGQTGAGRQETGGR
ncbi:MAG: ABC transporter ATP-binding protein [Alphaproteobacteria bacterium]|nr:MAG: ABC transporter ATP-binding protein [Alphaproteobacteria bacterium]